MLPKIVTCAAVLVAATVGIARGDAVERMNLENLRATHAAIEALQADWQAVGIDAGYRDCRAVLHVHSHLSHDSIGSVEEIVAGAKAAGVEVILFAEHPADNYDYIDDGHHGVVDGVLLIPGAETGGFLALPRRSLRGASTNPPQQFADAVRGTDGLVFLSHLEERMDWDIDGMTGTEIYNTHADLKDETRLLARLRQPIGVLGLMPALKQFPQELFGALLDYPADYLRRFDEYCRKSPHTGVAANDSHHNQRMLGIVTGEGHLRIEDALGKTLAELDPEKTPLVGGFVKDRAPGDVVIDVDLDPYERSFRHTSTHLLVGEVTEDAVREALSAGRAYVAFDWMADPTGFVFRATRDDRHWPPGSRIAAGEGLVLEAAAPLPCFFRVIRDGAEIQQSIGRDIALPVEQPGIYRVEAWLNLAGERRIWILSNPIYIDAAE